MEDSRIENKRFCRCGCGSIIPKPKYPSGQRYYINGHNLANQAGSNNNNWRGGRIINAGYIMIRKLDHPFRKSNGYVYEHRLMMEAYLGRYLDPEEEVHHINRNKQDNRLENLSLHIGHSEHARYHANERWLKVRRRASEW